MVAILMTSTCSSEIVTHWFTHIVLSALRRSGNENKLSRYSRISNDNPTKKRRYIQSHIRPPDLLLTVLLQIHIKMDMERRSVKVKELQERCTIKAFKLSYQEKYEHVDPKSQVHKMVRLLDDVKRLCLVDDLKKFKITFMSSQRYKSKPKVKDH
ncbi:hypothetical protein Tco_0060972 [Tanacetum coccineum]